MYYLYIYAVVFLFFFGKNMHTLYIHVVFHHYCVCNELL